MQQIASILLVLIGLTGGYLAEARDRRYIRRNRHGKQHRTLYAQRPTVGCPKGCQCISADLLQGDSPGLLVQCANTRFVDIGSVLLHVTAAYPNSEITWLVLYNNTFAQSTLRQSSFYDTGVTASLRYLAIEASNIDDIEPMTFARLTGLRTLSLRQLKLRTFRSGALAGLNLESLDLSGNNFARGITPEFFESLTVERLAINYANLSILTAERIGPIINQLRAMEFEGNNLRTLHRGLERFMNKMEYVKFAHNPWNCAPSLLWFKRFYDRHTEMFRLETSDDLYCASPPHLANRRLIDVTVDDIAPFLKVKITTTSTTTQIPTTSKTTTSTTTTTTATTTTTTPTSTTSSSTPPTTPSTSTSTSTKTTALPTTTSTTLPSTSTTSTTSTSITTIPTKSTSPSSTATSTTSTRVPVKSFVEMLLPTSSKTKNIPLVRVDLSQTTEPNNNETAAANLSNHLPLFSIVAPVAATVTCVAAIIGIALYCYYSPYRRQEKRKASDTSSENMQYLVANQSSQPTSTSQSSNEASSSRCSSSTRENAQILLLQYECFMQSSSSSPTNSQTGQNQSNRFTKIYDYEMTSGQESHDSASLSLSPLMADLKEPAESDSENRINHALSSSQINQQDNDSGTDGLAPFSC